MKKLPIDELNRKIGQSSIKQDFTVATSISKSSYNQISDETAKSSIRHEYNTQRAYFSSSFSTEPSTSYQNQCQNKNHFNFNNYTKDHYAKRNISSGQCIFI